MRLNKNLIIGGVISIMALYYWLVLTDPLEPIPLIYRFTFCLLPYLDIVWTALGIWFLYRGFKQLKGYYD